MSYLERIRKNGQSGINDKKKSGIPYRTEPAKPAKGAFAGFAGSSYKDTHDFFSVSSLKQPSGPCSVCGSNHFWLSATGWQCWGCTEPEPLATRLCLPASQAPSNRHKSQ